MMQDQKIIKSKVGLLKLAQTLGSVSDLEERDGKACGLPPSNHA